MSGEGAETARSLAAEVDRGFRLTLAAIAVLLAVSIGLLSYVLGSVRPAQRRYQSGERALELAHAGMLDQETGLRGYLLVHDRRFLAPYRQGAAAIATENAALERYFGSDAGIASALLEMRVAQQAWVSQWAVVAAGGRAPRAPAALDAFLFEGKALFDTYRADESALGARVRAQRDSLYSRESVVFGAGLGAFVLFGIGLIVAMFLQRARLSQIAVAPVAGILQATEAIAQGDLDSAVVPIGASEFRRIGLSINAMREALAAARERDRASREQIEAQSAQLRNILTMSRDIGGSLNLGYVVSAVATAATTVSGFPRAIVWLRGSGNSDTLTALFDTAVGGAPTDESRAELGVGVVGHAVRFGRAATQNEADEPVVEVHPERPLQSLAVPLVVGAQVTGAVELSSPTPHRMIGGGLDVLQTLASHAAAAIEAARLHGYTERLAQTDGLTGLANRRRLDADLAAECERAARYRRPLALIMLDVDHFKAFNDSFGHLKGDETLQELADTIRRELRATDTAYRYGGEEFAVLTRETDAEHAVTLAERLRARIEAHFAAPGSPRTITASFGVGSAPPDEPTPEALIASADAALYRAKLDGRNRVGRGDAAAPAPDALAG